LRPQGLIESEGAPQFLFICSASRFAEHDFDGIAGYQVNQHKDQR